MRQKGIGYKISKFTQPHKEGINFFLKNLLFNFYLKYQKS